MLGLILAMAAAAAPAPSADEAAALAAASRLLGRLTGKDPAAMQALTLPQGGATAVATGKDGKQVVRHFTWAEFFAHLPKDKPVVEEHMTAPLVRVDGDVALVWGRYQVTVDGKFLHCGTDHFDLVRVEGTWRILNVTWNQVTTGCGR
ncbi:MAG: nuclear transport factor 2 family protein [Alphaproteobacteria bacterium]|nr:nuclear transport factor 2 family protein [Alphaproteobacteria bacterium]